MYISIDRTNMRFVHKCDNHRTASLLAFIELPDVSVVITPFEPAYLFEDFTQLELELLYRNTTGVDHSASRAHELQAVVSELAARLPVTEAVEWQVKLQADSLPECHSVPYQYVLGATKPALSSGLWSPVTLNAPKSETEQTIANAARPRVKAPAVQPPAVAPRVPAQRTARPAGAQRAVIAPRQGGVREKIWAIADQLWEEAGKPTEKSTILALRKKMMDKLETDGVKRTSSSNELGNWQKARIK